MAGSRFLFVTWGGGGNVPPAVGLAQRLAERGHAVRFLAAPELRNRIEAAGFEFASFPSAGAPLAAVAVEDQLQDFVQTLAGEAAARDVLAEIERRPTDALVVDCMQLNALCAAELSGVPTAVLVHLLYEPWRMHPGFGEMVRGLVNETRAALGMSQLTEELVLAQMWDPCGTALVVTPAEFDFRTPDLPANVRYVGPIFEPSSEWPSDLPWPPGEAEPLVLVSFSSTYMHQEEAIRRTTEAVAATDVRCLVTLGEALDDVAVPSGVVARRWIPHSAVLPETSLVVTHAGHATVMAALAHGVPMVCMPMGRDQFSNARRVEEIGAGRTVAMDASVDDIRAAVVEVLGNDEYRAGAKRMAGTIASYGNGEAAIGELERLTG